MKLLLALVLSSPFWGLGHPLWETDDARYAEVPREMVELGDWLTPRLDYFEYVEKPPLIYWLPALSYKLFGVSEAAAACPTPSSPWRVCSASGGWAPGCSRLRPAGGAPSSWGPASSTSCWAVS